MFNTKIVKAYGLKVVVAGLSMTIAGAAMAQSSPAMISVGNGTPVAGSSSSQIGVSALKSTPNGNPNSIRLLGDEKTAGVSTTALNGQNNNGPTELQVHTPVDGIAKGIVSK